MALSNWTADGDPGDFSQPSHLYCPDPDDTGAQEAFSDVATALGNAGDE